VDPLYEAAIDSPISDNVVQPNPLTASQPSALANVTVHTLKLPYRTAFSKKLKKKHSRVQTALKISTTPLDYARFVQTRQDALDS
jgi:hypothetical protein